MHVGKVSWNELPFSQCSLLLLLSLLSCYGFSKLFKGEYVKCTERTVVIIIASTIATTITSHCSIPDAPVSLMTH